MSVREGSTVWTDQRQRLTLGRLVKSGGAGSVFLLREDASSVAKIYHADVDHPLYERKIAAMLGLSPELPPLGDGTRRYVQIAWPSALLRDGNGRFLGFLMPALDIAATSELELILMERQARAAGLPTGLGARITLAANLSAVIAELHRQHHFVVDLKPVNLRFYRQSLYMAMLDCDGFSIQGRGERFHAPQFTIDYLAPEFQKNGIRKASEEPQDRFALAVIVFQLLNFGIHPYSGRPASDRVPTDLPGRIAGHWYGYGVSANGSIAPNPSSGHVAMPTELRLMFDRAFGRNAALRPAAAEWSSLLRGYATRSSRRLATCSKQTAHQHFAGYACAACARESLIASTQAKQRAKPGAQRKNITFAPRGTAAARRPPAPARYAPQTPAVSQPQTLGAVLAVLGRWFMGLSWKNRFNVVVAVIFAIIWFAGILLDSPSYQPSSTPTPAPTVEELVYRAPAPAPMSAPPPDDAEAPAVAKSTTPEAQEATRSHTELAQHIGKASDIETLRRAVNALWSAPSLNDRATPWSREQYDSAIARYLLRPESVEANKAARAVLEMTLADIVDRDPFADRVLFELAWMRFLDGHRDRARNGFESTLRVNPLNAEAWYGFGVTAADPAETIGALAIAEALAETSAEAENISRRFQLPSVASAGIDAHRHAILRARARRMVLKYRREPVPESVEWLANRDLAKAQ